jgi:hypothetical protein
MSEIISVKGDPCSTSWTRFIVVIARTLPPKLRVYGGRHGLTNVRNGARVTGLGGVLRGRHR